MRCQVIGSPIKLSTKLIAQPIEKLVNWQFALYWARTMAHSTASATSASSKTMSADLPPSSMDVGRRFAAAATFTRRPVATLPVKATLLTPGCELHQHRASDYRPFRF